MTSKESINELVVKWTKILPRVPGDWLEGEPLEAVMMSEKDLRISEVTEGGISDILVDSETGPASRLCPTVHNHVKEARILRTGGSTPEENLRALDRHAELHGRRTKLPDRITPVIQKTFRQLANYKPGPKGNTTGKAQQGDNLESSEPDYMERGPRSEEHESRFTKPTRTVKLYPLYQMVEDSGGDSPTDNSGGVCTGQSSPEPTEPTSENGRSAEPKQSGGSQQARLSGLWLTYMSTSRHISRSSAKRHRGDESPEGPRSSHTSPGFQDGSLWSAKNPELDESLQNPAKPELRSTLPTQGPPGAGMLTTPSNTREGISSDLSEAFQEDEKPGGVPTQDTEPTLLSVVAPHTPVRSGSPAPGDVKADL